MTELVLIMVSLTFSLKWAMVKAPGKAMSYGFGIGGDVRLFPMSNGQGIFAELELNFSKASEAYRAHYRRTNPYIAYQPPTMILFNIGLLYEIPIGKIGTSWHPHVRVGPEIYNYEHIFPSIASVSGMNAPLWGLGLNLTLQTVRKRKGGSYGFYIVSHLAFTRFEAFYPRQSEQQLWISNPEGGPSFRPFFAAGVFVQFRDMSGHEEKGVEIQNDLILEDEIRKRRKIRR